MNVDVFNGTNRKDACCGCTACVDNCPVDAITMVADEEGFLYPKVNTEVCIACGKCTRECAFLSYVPKETKDERNVYGMRHCNESIRSESRSGGAFTLISDWFLGQDGVVYGAGYTDGFRVVHKRAACADERDALRKSKYVQSDMSGIIPQIKKDIDCGKMVLFSGTACQVAAVQKACCNAPNLYTIDIVCHGAPSPLIWKEYLEYVKNRCKDTNIIDADFRTKAEFGWRSHIEKVVFENKKYYSSKYRQLFYNDSVLRPCCYNCKYTSLNRPADFTIGDFWGLDGNAFDDNKGVSLIICGNRRAKEIFSKLQAHVAIIEYDENKLVHPNLKQPTPCPKCRSDFWKVYAGHNIKGVIKKYTMPEIVEYALIGLSWVKWRFAKGKARR